MGKRKSRSQRHIPTPTSATASQCVQKTNVAGVNGMPVNINSALAWYGPPSGGKTCCRFIQTSTMERFHSKTTYDDFPPPAVRQTHSTFNIQTMTCTVIKPHPQNSTTSPLPTVNIRVCKSYQVGDFVACVQEPGVGRERKAGVGKRRRARMGKWDGTNPK